MNSNREVNGSLRPPPAVVPLLEALRDPAACASYDPDRWDRVIRLARNARLLGVLAHRVVGGGLADDRLPEAVARQLRAGRIEAGFRRQKTHYLLQSIVPLLAGHAGPWVLLKGAAYIAQEQPLSHGRLPGDVDLMVPRTALDGIERVMLNAGWEFQKTEPYDMHYYRAWSHELPPLQAAGQALELDLHHDILPPVGRIRPATERLFADSVPIAGTPFRALCPHDQLLHAIAHLVEGSDGVGRLRDLLDIDAMFRALPLADAAARAALLARARLHGMERPLRLGAALCAVWFDTPGADELPVTDGSLLHGRSVVRLMTRVLGPPDLGTPPARTAARLLVAREHWLRMPPWLLAYHASAKAVRSLIRRGEAEPARA